MYLHEKITVLFIVVVVSYACGAIWMTAATYERPVYETKAWEPPKIPKCDKELWERIRNRCKTNDKEEHDVQ